MEHFPRQEAKNYMRSFVTNKKIVSAHFLVNQSLYLLKEHMQIRQRKAGEVS